MSLLQSIGWLAVYALVMADEGWPLRLPQADPWRASVEVPSAAVSADGSVIAFVSYAWPRGDGGSLAEIHTFDTRTGGLALETVAHDGSAANGSSAHPALSADGRVLVFSSTAGNLTGGGPATVHPRIFLRDRWRGETRLVDAGIEGGAPDGGSYKPSLDGAGSRVVFESNASNLVAGDANGLGADVYLADLRAGTLARVSVNGAGIQPAIGTSFTPSLSADGTRVAFTSTADLECGRRDAACPPWQQDTNGLADVYVHDLVEGWTRRVSRASDGGEVLGPSYHPAISRDGRFVAFVSAADTLAAADHNGAEDVFVYDLDAGVLTLVSRRAGGRGSANGRSLHPQISGDGRFVGFQSQATDLVGRPPRSARAPDGGRWDVFLADRARDRISRITAEPGGAPWGLGGTGPRLDASAQVVAFHAIHQDRGPVHQPRYDLFVRRLKRPLPHRTAASDTAGRPSPR